jgi:hypothetical protein
MGIVRDEKTKIRRNIRAALLAVATPALGTALAFAGEARDSGPVVPPPVPAILEVEAGHEAFLVGHAVGTQNYVCLPLGAAFAWALFTPEAVLLDDDAHQIITHFFGPNPVEGGTIRAAWRHSRDSSVVWGRAVQTSSDSAFVAPGAIPWLLINVKDTGAQGGPTGGDRLTRTTFIHRVNTSGGKAPATGCSVAGNVGDRAFVPYTADYFFYEKAHGDDDQE